MSHVSLVSCLICLMLNMSYASHVSCFIDFCPNSLEVKEVIIITIIQVLEVIPLLLFATISDISSYKIKNSIIISFIIIGLATNIFINTNNILDYLVATILPIVALFILFALKMLGAGDIKLFCAIGSIVGTFNVAYCIIYSFLAGGAIALVVIIKNRSAMISLRNISTYFKCCILTQSLLPYKNDAGDANGCFHFSIAIVCGTMLMTLMTCA